jgi:hypothetical protein
LYVNYAPEDNAVLDQSDLILGHRWIDYELLPVDDLFPESTARALMALFVQHEVVGYTRKGAAFKVEVKIAIHSVRSLAQFG